MKALKLMKAVTTLLVPVIFASPGFADSASQTILDGTANRTAHYYSLDIHSGKVLGAAGQIAGAQWGSIYNDSIAIGLSVNGLLNNIPAPSSKGAGGLAFYYYGIQSEYEAFNWSVFNLNAGLFAGLGEVGYRAPNSLVTGERGAFKDATVQILEASAIATINLSPRAKAGFGLAYRYSSHPNLSGISADDLSGLNFILSLRSGTF